MITKNAAPSGGEYDNANVKVGVGTSSTTLGIKTKEPTLTFSKIDIFWGRFVNAGGAMKISEKYFFKYFDSNNHTDPV